MFLRHLSCFHVFLKFSILPVICSQRAQDFIFTAIYTNLRFKVSLSHLEGQGIFILTFQRLEHLPA